MTRWIPALSFTAVALLTAFVSPDPLPLGSALPLADVKLKDISGESITIKQAEKKNGVLVMFSCNTCPYVVRNQERTREICNYAKKMEVGVVLLNSNEGYRDGEDSFSAMKEYARDQQYKWIYAVDKNNALADAFGAKRTPECYLFNSDLRLVYHGAIDNSPGDEGNVTRKHLQLAIDELVAGKEISVKESKSVGCSIKRVNG